MPDDIPDYIYERADWPKFRWSERKLEAQLASVRHDQGFLLGRMGELGFKLQGEAVLATLTEDVVKSSAIEGEELDQELVRSSIARRLGMEIGGLAPVDHDVEGVVEMMLDATQKFENPLTKERLFDWHAALFPTGRSGMSKITVGLWRKDRDGPMQVVSGPFGRQRVHYQAPAAKDVDSEMANFLAWFNAPDSLDPVVTAAIAHLWFVTNHPFEDGNGRIARAIADMALARSEKSSQRFYSMSAQIRRERDAYYDILEATQKRDLDITPWLEWFLDCLGRAIHGADNILAAVLTKARFWQAHAGEDFNDRQRKLLNRLLDGFEGKLTSSKWATIAKTSQDTASRDIDDLIRRQILAKEPGGGRSTSYRLVATTFSGSTRSNATFMATLMMQLAAERRRPDEALAPRRVNQPRSRPWLPATRAPKAKLRLPPRGGRGRAGVERAGKTSPAPSWRGSRPPRLTKIAPV